MLDMQDIGYLVYMEEKERKEKEKAEHNKLNEELKQLLVRELSTQSKNKE